MVMMMQLTRRYKNGGCSHGSAKDQNRGRSSERKSRITGAETLSMTAIETTPADSKSAFNGNTFAIFICFSSICRLLVEFTCYYPDSRQSLILSKKNYESTVGLNRGVIEG